MTYKERIRLLEAEVEMLKAKVALLEAQKITFIPVPYTQPTLPPYVPYTTPNWGPTWETPTITCSTETLPDYFNATA